MSIDRLSSTSSLIAALRAELTQRRERTERRAQAGASGQVDAPRTTASRDVQALRKQLTEIVKDVSVDDEAAVKAIRPRVIRAVLLWEFGPELREYGEWQPMIESIVATLEEDSAHRDSFLQLIREFHSL